MKNKDINLSLISELLSIPTLAEIESEFENIDPLKIYKTIDVLNHLFGTKLKKELYFKLQEIEKNIDKKAFNDEFGCGSTFPQVICDGKRIGGSVETVKFLREQKIITV